MTQGELAASAGCSLKTIAKIESGERRPSKQLAELLAGTLGIGRDDLPAFMLLARGVSGTTGPLALSTASGAATPEPIAQQPPPQTTSNNLPAPLTEFVGRDEMVALLCVMMRRPYTRLVTLVGAGGVGKTRLSIEVASELLDDFPDGVFFIDLSAVDDSALFPSALVRGLGLEEAKGKPPLESAKAHLHDRAALLVFDNFERVLEAAPLVTELLEGCRGVKALVTSREGLCLRGERQVQVPPLKVPRGDATLPWEDLARYESLQLFAARARDRRPDFALDRRNVSAVAGICLRVDGLPLAIELAAARAGELSPHEMLQQLDSRLQSLTGPLVDLPQRQRTLDNAIAWSYEPLGADAQQLFRRLAVFSGGFTPSAVSAILGADGDSPDSILARLEELAGKSLLTSVQARQSDEPRFSMLEPLREYALEKLEQSGEAEPFRHRHAAHFLALAREADAELRGARQKYWFDRLEDEHDNFRAALRWSLADEDPEPGLSLCGWLTMFWYYRGYAAEGRRWIARALERAGSASAQLRAKLFNAAGIFAWAQSDFDEARRSYESSLAVWRELGDPTRTAGSLYNIAGVLLVEGKFGEARAMLEELVPILRETGNRTVLSSTLNRLSVVMEQEGDLDRAAALCDECLALDTEIGDARHMSTMKARLGSIALKRGDISGARRLLNEALGDFRDLGDKENIAETLEKLGTVEGACGRAARAAQLFGTASAIRDAIASPLTPLHYAGYEPHLGEARSALGEDEWQGAWAAGRSMAIEQAIAYALERAL